MKLSFYALTLSSAFDTWYLCDIFIAPFYAYMYFS